MGVLDKLMNAMGYSKGNDVVPAYTPIAVKSSQAYGVGEEFNYGQALNLLNNNNTAIGIPQPRKLKNFDDYVKLYGESIWVYACVYLISNTLANVPFKLYVKQRNGKLKKLDEHPLLKVLHKPNPYMSGYDLKEAISAALELTGNAYLEEVKVEGLPMELWPLQPQRMKVVKNKGGSLISGYAYEVAGKPIPFNADEITHIRYYNPRSDYYGASPLMAGELSTISDIEAANWNKNFFKNAARPDAVLESDQNLSPTVASRLRTQWNSLYKGVGKAHQVAILEGGLKYRQISLTQTDLDFINLRKLTREEILVIYGVFPSLLGLPGGTKASMQEERRNFWEATILPKMEKIQTSINFNLVEPLDDKLVLLFDKDSIEGLKESREIRARIAAMLVDRGIMTQNEARGQFFGLEPVEWGNTWYMPLNLVPTDHVGSGMGDNPSGQDVPGRDRGRPAVDQETIKPKPKELTYASEVDPETGEVTIKSHSTMPFIPINLNDPLERTLRKAAFKNSHGQHEKDFTALTNDMFNKQLARLLKAIRSGERDPERLAKLLDMDKQLYRGKAEGLIEKILKDSGDSAMSEIEELANEMVRNNGK